MGDGYVIMQFARIYKDIISLILLGGGVIGLPTFLWATADAVLLHLVDASSTTWNGYGKFLFAIVVPIILTLLIVLVRELLRVSKEGKEEIETAKHKISQLEKQHETDIQTLNNQNTVTLEKLKESSYKEVQQLNADVSKFQGHVRKYLTVSKKIIEFLHPEQEVKNKAVYKDFSYEIETAANGDTKVTENFSLIVGQEPVHWVKNEIFSDPESTPIDWHDDISLTVHVKNLDTNKTQEAEILPTEIKENEFSYSVVFLPLLAPNSRYEVIVSYLWPGLSMKIVQDTWIDWAVEKKALEQGTEIRISTEFDNALGVLKPEITRSKGVNLEMEPYTEARNSRHVFSGAVISKEEIQVGIKFEKTNP